MILWVSHKSISKKTPWSSRCIFGVKWIVFAFKMALNIANDVPACSLSKKWGFVGAISQTKMLLLTVIIIIHTSLYHISPLPFLTNGHSLVMVPRLQSQEYIPLLERDLDLAKVQPSQKSIAKRNIFTILRFELRFLAIFSKIKPKIDHVESWWIL